MKGEVLLTGGTGMVGPGVARALLAAGWSVRVLARDASRVPAGCVAVPGEMTDEPSLREACSGVEFVVHMAARKNDEPDSVVVNVEGARMLGAAAKAAGVCGIVHLSTQSVRLTRRGVYGQTKLMAERALDDCGVPTVHLRASVVYGDGTEGIVGAILGAAKLPCIPVLGDGRARFRPIHRDDLGRVIASLLAGSLRPATYDVGGNEEYTYDELVRTILSAHGMRRMLVHLPTPIALPLARALSAVLPRPPITVSNVLGAAEDLPFDPAPVLTLSGVQLRAFREAVSKCRAPRMFNDRAEAVLLLEYVGSACGLPGPSETAVDRYLAALGTHGISTSPSLGRRTGRLRLMARDIASRLREPSCQFQKKLLIAAAIREADPDGASLVPRMQTKAGVLGSLLSIGVVCILVAPLAAYFFLTHGRR